nr:MAG TPA: hypothetical protein [Inoviridae sp.]
MRKYAHAIIFCIAWAYLYITSHYEKFYLLKKSLNHFSILSWSFSSAFFSLMIERISAITQTAKITKMTSK